MVVVVFGKSQLEFLLAKLIVIQGSNSRYFDIDHWATRYGLIQIPKASKSEKNEGCDDLEEKQYSHDGRNKEIENPYQRNKSVASNNHPTVKPVHLMAWLVQLISKKGDIVLDPFMGSGTTGVACMQLDRNFPLVLKWKKNILKLPNQE